MPISWRKCELSSTLRWIGWNFHIRAGFLTVPEDKFKKTLQYLDLLVGNRTSRKRMEKAIGITMWLTQLWPYMLIWLHHLYKDLYSIPASLFSINLDNWPAVMNSIDEQLKFQHQPAHTGIPVGSTLVSIGHQSVTSLSDLHNLRLRDRISHSRPRIIPPKALRRFEASHQTLSRLDFRTSTYPEFVSTAILARAGSSRCHGSWRK